jgi:hypothetical protein
MFPVDVVIWERFLEKYPARCSRYEYDVKVGEGIPVDPSWPENIQRMATQLTQGRVDVVGFSPGVVHIIEVKPDASFSALGQVLGYMFLYKLTYPGMYRLVGEVVSDRVSGDAARMFEENAIAVFIV